MNQEPKLQISSAGLHILAMGLMLCDHIWATVYPAEWLTCVGRIAFPIFAFLLAEGFRRTRNLRRYLLRLLAWALLAEIPFNLMYSSLLFYPYHQNVLWTFLLGLLIILGIERCRARFRPAAAAALLVLLGYLLGYAAFTDYYGVGVLTVLVFYFFPRRNWTCFLGQLLCLYFLNVRLLGGYYYDLRLFGVEFELVQQGLALLALIPIWLYRGRQGYHSRGFQLFCYAFYPAHMLVLALLRTWMLS